MSFPSYDIPSRAMACFSGSGQTRSTTPMHNACFAVIVSAATNISRAQGRSAVSEERIGCRDATVARERQVESAAHALPRDDGVHRGREVLDFIHQCLPYF